MTMTRRPRLTAKVVEGLFTVCGLAEADIESDPELWPESGPEHEALQYLWDLRRWYLRKAESRARKVIELGIDP